LIKILGEEKGSVQKLVFKRGRVMQRIIERPNGCYAVHNLKNSRNGRSKEGFAGVRKKRGGKGR